MGNKHAGGSGGWSITLSTYIKLDRELCSRFQHFISGGALKKYLGISASVICKNIANHWTIPHSLRIDLAPPAPRHRHAASGPGELNLQKIHYRIIAYKHGL